MNKLMSGKKGIVMGITNEASIAWSIAKALNEQGAELAFSYPTDAIKKRLTPLGESLGSKLFYECNVTNSEQVKTMFDNLGKEWPEIDFLVHAIAFSDKNELKGRFLDTNLDNFLNTMHVSVYSFVETTKHASALMKNGGSAITLTYYGAEKVLPNYNVMGVAKAALESSVRYMAEDLGRDNIRVNAISAGPIKTLAASGIGDFKYILDWNANNSPLRRNVKQSEVAQSALYLLSDMASGVTGEIHYVDCGYNIVGMKAITAPDISKQ